MTPSSSAIGITITLALSFPGRKQLPLPIQCCAWQIIMNVIVTAGVVWVLLQNRGPCECSTRILNWQAVLSALPISFCITSFVSLLSVQLACIHAYGNVGGHHFHCWVSLVCLSLIGLISSLTVFILHMRLCSVACVFWTSLAMAFKALCLKWCNLQWCHGQSSCVHSVRRGLSYHNA